MDAGRESRAARAVVFAAVCVLLAALGHVMMSGVDVPWWALTAGFTGIGAIGWCCTGRERGQVFITTVTVVTQVILHSLFTFSQATAAGPARGGESLAQQWVKALLCRSGARAGLSLANAEHLVQGAGFSHQLSGPPSGMDSMGSMNSMPGMDLMGHTSPMGMSPTAGHSSAYGMLAAHLLAAFLCGLWLAHGERAAFRIGRALAARLFVPLLFLIRIAEPPYRPMIRADHPRSSHRLRSLLLVHAITTRGPPRGIAVA